MINAKKLISLFTFSFIILTNFTFLKVDAAKNPYDDKVAKLLANFEDKLNKGKISQEEKIKKFEIIQSKINAIKSKYIKLWKFKWKNKDIINSLANLTSSKVSWLYNDKFIDPLQSINSILKWKDKLASADSVLARQKYQLTETELKNVKDKQNAFLDQIKRDSELDNISINWDEQYKTRPNIISWIEKRASSNKENDIKSIVTKIDNVLWVDENKTDLKLNETKIEAETWRKFSKFAQVYDWVKVFWWEIIMSETKSWNIDSVITNLAPDINISTKPSIKDSVALEVGYKKLSTKWKLTLTKNPELIIFPNWNENLLSYKYELSYNNSNWIWKWIFIVDANSWQELLSYNDIKNATSPWNSWETSKISWNRLKNEDWTIVSFNWWKDSIAMWYFLTDKNLWYSIRSMNPYAYPGNYIFSKTNDLWNTDNTAISAAKNIELTLSYFKNNFSYWIKDLYKWYTNAELPVTVHVPSDNWEYNYANAFWNWEGIYIWDWEWFIWPLATLDIMAHEFWHGWTQSTSWLIYWWEQWALNESFSDIVWATVEIKSQPDWTAWYPSIEGWKSDWIIWEDINPYWFRDMKNPLSHWYPSKLFWTNWSYWTYDNWWVHINSSVQNFFYYLLVNWWKWNNDWIDYNVTWVGIDKAMRLAYNVNSYYLTSNSDYYDAKDLWIKAANDMDTSWTLATSVTQAWSAVGVSNELCETYDKHMEGWKCISNEKPCSMQNWTWKQIWSNWTWWSCVTDKCNSWYFEDTTKSKCLQAYDTKPDYSYECTTKTKVADMRQGDVMIAYTPSPTWSWNAFYWQNTIEKNWAIYHDSKLENTSYSICTSHNNFLVNSKDWKQLMYNTIWNNFVWSKLILDWNTYFEDPKNLICSAAFTDDWKNIAFKTVKFFDYDFNLYINKENKWTYNSLFAPILVYWNNFLFHYISNWYTIYNNWAITPVKYKDRSWYLNASYYDKNTKDIYYAITWNENWKNYIDIYKNFNYHRTFEVPWKSIEFWLVKFFDWGKIWYQIYDNINAWFNYYFEWTKIDNYTYSDLWRLKSLQEMISSDWKSYMYYWIKPNWKATYIYSWVESDEYDDIYASAISPDFKNYAAIVYKYWKIFPVINWKEYKSLYWNANITKVINNIKTSNININWVKQYNAFSKNNIEAKIQKWLNYWLYINNSWSIIYQEDYSLYELGCQWNKVTCNTWEHEESWKCVSNTQWCTVTNWSGQKTWANWAWWSCIVSYCVSWYKISADKLSCDKSLFTISEVKAKVLKNVIWIHWANYDYFEENWKQYKITYTAWIQNIWTSSYDFVNFNYDISKEILFYVDSTYYITMWGWYVEIPANPTNYPINTLSSRVKFYLPKSSLKQWWSVTMPEYIKNWVTCTAFANPISDQTTYWKRSVIELTPDWNFVDPTDSNIITKINLWEQLLFQAQYSDNFFLSKQWYTEQCFSN